MGEISAEVPAFPFYIGTESIECWVVEMAPEHAEDPLDEAWVDWTDGEPSITMRVYDERVLLHEVMHVIFKREAGVLAQWVEAAKRAEDDGVSVAEEGIVRALTAGLFGMGWRWMVRDRHEQAVERDRRRAFEGRERALASVEAEARDDHAGHDGEFESCARGICGVFWRAVVAART